MNLSAKTRAYIYAILLAVQPLAIAYGFISHDMSVLWINVIGAVLNGSLALTNITPDAPKQQTATVTTTTTHVDIPAAQPAVAAPEAPVAPATDVPTGTDVPA